MSERVLDAIYIENLYARAQIGIDPEEQGKKQNIIINVKLEADLSRVYLEESIDNTIDYKKIEDQILNLVEHKKFNLIETLANEIIMLCFEGQLVQKLTVKVAKAGALVCAEKVAVELSRTREQIS